MVDLAVLSVQLDLIVFEVLSNVNKSVMILVLMFLFLKIMLYIQKVDKL